VYYINRLIQRGLYYVQVGSSLGGLPLSLLNFATIFYYNVVVSVAWLSGIFSAFQYFLLAAGFGIPVFFGLLGYIYKKKSNFYMSQVEIDVEANRYQMEKLTPVALPCWEMICEVADKLGVESIATKELLANSGSKKYATYKTR
jgi:hypothetical protein